MNDASSGLRTKNSDRISIATLCRPDGANGLDRTTAEALCDWARYVSDAAQAGSVRVAVLRNEGFAFSVGGDLRSFAAAEDFADELRYVATRLHDALRILTALPIPLVVAVDGVVAGAGVGIAMAGDVVLASDSSKFRMAYLAVGFSPDGGGSWQLARRLGHARAAEFALSNRVMGADEALSLGMVSRVVLADELATMVDEFVMQLAHAPKEAVAETLRLLRSAHSRSLDEQLDDEVDSVARLSQSPDGIEGVAAFFGKRQPIFF
ncbi:enoyl-CoA hydratase/isomerase family protein [Rhodococcus jostii]|uniref:enoyl-CoA hydratase/isomerase family protein n=1 Tax=Rhodococcus jostii TaxID=132919 RepID=UPI00365931F4